MNLLIFTQAEGGGAFTLLANVAKFLSSRHQVTLVVPEKARQWALRFAGVPNLQILSAQSGELGPPTSASYDVGLFHLPISIDPIAKAQISRKILVVMELLDVYPFSFDKEELSQFSDAIYLHDDQGACLRNHFKIEQCHKLPIVNDIDFELPFSKTNTVASIGSADFKHDLPLVLEMLGKTPNCRHFNLYSRDQPPIEGRRTRLLTFFFSTLGRLHFRGIESDVKKLFSSFDCLFHIPRNGNGTSMVVSAALQCGKPVVLSSLDAYRKAYSGITGVYFAQDVKYNLTQILKNYSPEISMQIKHAYKRIYNRELALQQWETALLEH